VLGTLLAVMFGCGAALGPRPLESQLMPIDSELAVFGSSRTYRLATRAKLLGPRPVGVHVIVFPSFQNEWAVQIAYDRGRPFVLLASMETSLWYSLQRRVEDGELPESELFSSSVPVNRSTADLEPPAAQAVERAWASALAAAQWPVEMRRVLDGTSYLFFGVGPKAPVGLAREPEAGTPAAALAELVEALRRYVEARPEERQTTEAEIARRAKDVLRRLGAR
jgi:hypothetical protein